MESLHTEFLDMEGEKMVLYPNSNQFLVIPREIGKAMTTGISVLLSDLSRVQQDGKDSVTLIKQVKKSDITRYHSVCLPEMTLSTYLMRIRKKLDLSESTLVTMLLLVLRAHVSYGVPLNLLTAHRLCLAALMAAYKTCEDYTIKARHWATAGGIAKLEVGVLGDAFLKDCDFDLTVTAAQYNFAVQLAAGMTDVNTVRHSEHVRRSVCPKSTSPVWTPLQKPLYRIYKRSDMNSPRTEKRKPWKKKKIAKRVYNFELDVSTGSDDNGDEFNSSDDADDEDCKLDGIDIELDA